MTADPSFELSPAAREQLGRQALAWVLAWFDGIGRRPLYPATSAADLERAIQGPLPLDPADPCAVLDEFASLVAPHARDNGHPRMFGYVQSNGTYAGAVADFLASALNQNVTSWRSAPSATTVDRQVVGWMKAMAGFPESGDGVIVSGGSMANLAALAAATVAACPEVARRGVRALPGDPVVYASSAVHMSIPKAAAMAGLGRDAVRRIPADDDFRIDVGALDRALAEDRRAGRTPVCVVANAGDVNTGAIDPLAAVADVCRRHRVWLHADAAYGGFARLAPSAARDLEPLGRVDSLSLDPHKWLFVPVDSGCLLVRDPSALRQAFSYAAEYVDVVADADMSAYAFWDHGPELTRRFRALKIWMTLKVYGVRALSEAIERNIGLARQLAAAIDASPDFERLAPVPLSIVNFRYAGSAPPAASEADDERLNALNRELMVRVQRAGRAYLSNAMIGNRFALRACIVNHRTSDDDLVILLDEIRRCAMAI